ncbi:DapH/DapD/GlmU-related protein [Deinococcus oregonensis]|uniref:DapH/DapD/GlmU-related protein n=1 Tax=Deinococcus oregonensis TaxID=1805970 RepID=A0ABV6AVS3_9DEIO
MKKLSPEPTVHPTALIRGTHLGQWTEIGANTSVVDSEVGDYSYLVHGCQVVDSRIGKFCSIASFVRLNPGNHPLERPTTHHLTYRSAQFDFGPDDEAFFEWRRAHPVRVGHDVWIGHNVTVMPGVTIGNGAALGSGAVVTKDVAPYTVAAGVPARTIRARFEDQLATRLEDMAWWDWPRELLEARLHAFRGNAQTFVDTYA